MDNLDTPVLQVLHEHPRERGFAGAPWPVDTEHRGSPHPHQSVGQRIDKRFAPEEIVREWIIRRDRDWGRLNPDAIIRRLSLIAGYDRLLGLLGGVVRRLLMSQSKHLFHQGPFRSAMTFALRSTPPATRPFLTEQLQQKDVRRRGPSQGIIPQRQRR